MKPWHLALVLVALVAAAFLGSHLARKAAQAQQAQLRLQYERLWSEQERSALRLAASRDSARAESAAWQRTASLHAREGEEARAAARRAVRSADALRTEVAALLGRAAEAGEAGDTGAQLDLCCMAARLAVEESDSLRAALAADSVALLRADARSAAQDSAYRAQGIALSFSDSLGLMYRGQRDDTRSQLISADLLLRQTRASLSAARLQRNIAVLLLAGKLTYDALR